LITAGLGLRALKMGCASDRQRPEPASPDVFYCRGHDEIVSAAHALEKSESMLGGDGRKKNGGARAGAGRKAGLPNSSTLEFRNYVRQYTKEAVDMFVAAMRDEKMDILLSSVST
jgi:hypothetical protein